MKQLIFFLLLFASILMLSSEAIALNLRGFVYLDDKGYSFIESETLKAYPIRPVNSSVQKELSKLKSFDSLIGSGDITPDGKLELLSIDFVSLLRLLGLWKSNSIIINFVDYSRVSFRLPKTRTDYIYAMTPGKGNSWRIFFTDEASVVLGAVSIQDSKAQIEFYDSHTGEITQSLELQKVQ